MGQTHHRVRVLIPVFDLALGVTVRLAASPADGAHSELNIVIVSLRRHVDSVRQPRVPLEGVAVTALDAVCVGAAGHLLAVAAENLHLRDVVRVIAPGSWAIVAEVVLVLVKLEGALAGRETLILLGVDAVLDDIIAEGAAMLPVHGVLRVIAITACETRQFTGSRHPI